MDATAAITQSLQAMAAQQTKMTSLLVANAAQPKALADGTGKVVWQADSYTPSTGATPEARVGAYAPGSPTAS